MRQYYYVGVASPAYKKSAPLTYYADNQPSLTSGALVKVSLRRSLAVGIILDKAPTPTFKTKPLLEIYDLPPLPVPLVTTLKWAANFYATTLSLSLSQFIPKSLLSAKDLTLAPKEPSLAYKQPPKLTKHQAAAYKQLPSSGSALLEGQTGSGKTRLYIEKALEVTRQGKSAIIMTPEISLTPQLLQTFTDSIGQSVLLTHSGLSPKKRFDVWLRSLLSNEPLIVIGPRSSLASPLKNIGLIVADEAHDDSYKQIGTPGFNSLHLASKLATEHKALFLMGSASPKISDYYFLSQKKRPIVQLTQKALGPDISPPKIDLIDIKDRTNFSRQNNLSNPLLMAIEQNLTKNNQTLLFLNRRGSARLIMCNNCGWRALCDHCGTPLTFHQDKFILRCHTCSRKQKVPHECPDCQNVDIIFKSAGTKTIEQTIKKLFPSATVGRFDTDNSKAESFDKNFTQVKSGYFDIIIGTQLLVKGLDLPKLTLVGVINADLSLQMPDYTSDERTFQLLSQIIGRVGRGHNSNQGHVIVQTLRPSNPVIQYAVHQQFNKFMAKELDERKKYNFPPFYYLLTLSIKDSSSEKAESKANKMYLKLQQNEQLITEQPMQSYWRLVQNKYQWRILIKSKRRSNLLKVIQDLPTEWQYDLEPISTL